MAQTHALGDLSVPIASYQKDGQTKKKGRRMGELLCTTDDGGGTPRYWLKIQAEMLSPSLLIILSRNKMIRQDDDHVIINVYADRDPGAAPASTTAAAEEPGPF